MKRLGSVRYVFLLLVVMALPSAAAAKVIRISNLEELYGAVNNPANAGETLVLSPGTYMLSATDPSNVARPNGGRIEMQPNMSIVGREGDRDAVVIDASELPVTSFPQANGPNAPVRMGLGFNALSWVTVQNAVNAQANIDVGLQAMDPGPAFIRLSHIASSGGTRGLEVIHYGPQTSGQTIEADITDSYFFNNVLGLGEGIRIGSFVGAVGGMVNIRMSGNVSWGNLTGRILENSRAQNSTINAFSSGNRFYDNQTGTIIFAGISNNNTRSDGNTINFEAHGDEFVGNTVASTLDQGGFLVAAAENDSTASGGGSNNTANVWLWDCRTLGNARADLTGIGARTPSASLAPLSVNNHVTIAIIGDHDRHEEPVEVFTNTLVGGVPGSLNYGNSVEVLR